MRNGRRVADILRANERLKATSTVIANLGSALLIAAVARWFERGSDPMAAVWLLASVIIISAGIYLLADLEMENGNG